MLESEPSTLLPPLEVRILPLLRGGAEPGDAEHPVRADPAADRVGDRDVLLPAVLQVRAGRAAGGGANIPDRNEALALAILAMTPAAVIVLLFQRMFIKDLVETEKRPRRW